MAFWILASTSASRCWAGVRAFDAGFNIVVVVVGVVGSFVFFGSSFFGGGAPSVSKESLLRWLSSALRRVAVMVMDLGEIGDVGDEEVGEVLEICSTGSSLRLGSRS